MLFTVNAALVLGINKCMPTSKDSKIMALVRKLVIIFLDNNILFKSQHIKGKLNLLADKLPRDHIVSFKQSAS